MKHFFWITASIVAMTTCAAMADASADSATRKAKAAASRPTDETALRGVPHEVYRTVGDVELKMYIFKPAGFEPSKKHPAVIFFFGGGWNHGFTGQFAEQCRYLASRGMVAMAPDYRVRSRNGNNIAECVADAQSAMRWTRANAARLGIDPDRIAAGGGSAGGHLAAACALLEDFTDDTDAKVSFRPNALILFNPVVDLVAFLNQRIDKAAQIERLGAKVEELSPAASIKKETPPTLIFHGTEDKAVPYQQVEDFTKQMEQAGNQCELVGFEGKGHGFYNSYPPGLDVDYKATLRVMDRFLTSLGYLDATSGVDQLPGRITKPD